MLLRLIWHAFGKVGFRWTLRYADDYVLVVKESSVWGPLISAPLRLRALDVPFKWSEFLCGQVFEWIGYAIDLTRGLPMMADMSVLRVTFDTTLRELTIKDSNVICEF